MLVICSCNFSTRSMRAALLPPLPLLPKPPPPALELVGLVGSLAGSGSAQGGGAPLDLLRIQPATICCAKGLTGFGATAKAGSFFALAACGEPGRLAAVASASASIGGFGGGPSAAPFLGNIWRACVFMAAIVWPICFAVVWSSLYFLSTFLMCWRSIDPSCKDSFWMRRALASKTLFCFMSSSSGLPAQRMAKSTPNSQHASPNSVLSTEPDWLLLIMSSTWAFNASTLFLDLSSLRIHEGIIGLPLMAAAAASAPAPGA
mmetsp:Transcript_4815/g.10840  ORF Transcript_4815/g.10840 Transcript_4815/m.10840 type:complete len:261 (+) Transcript_4815:485-1267(+)